MSQHKVISIDVQPYYTTIVVYEYGKATKVGDGYLKTIPNLASGSLFGSQYLRKVPKSDYVNDFINPYQSQSLQRLQDYTEGLYRIIFEYIGFQEPNYSINKYDVAFVFQGETLTAPLKTLARVLRRKFNAAQFFMSNKVLLSCISAQKDELLNSKIKNVLVVNLGEQQTDFVFVDVSSPQAQLKKQLSIEQGWYEWYQKALVHFRGLFGGSAQLNPIFFLENMTEFLQGLSETTAGLSKIWDGPYQHLIKQNHKEDSFTQDGFYNLAGVRPFINDLKQQLSEILAEANAENMMTWVMGRGGKWLLSDSDFGSYNIYKLYDEHGYELHYCTLTSMDTNLKGEDIEAGTHLHSDSKKTGNPLKNSDSSWDWIEKVN
jgi:hypothetical protein